MAKKKKTAALTIDDLAGLARQLDQARRAATHPNADGLGDPRAAPAGQWCAATDENGDQHGRRHLAIDPATKTVTCRAC